MDDMVANQYRRLRDADKGPRPYFADSLRPPVYVDCVIIEMSRGGVPHPDEPVAWDGLGEREGEGAEEEEKKEKDRLMEDRRE